MFQFPLSFVFHSMVHIRKAVYIFLIYLYTMGLCLSIAETILESSGPETCDATTGKPTDSKGLYYAELPEGAQKYRVRNVYDGDTLTLTDEQRVRLLGIDTPEMKPPQPFSKEAKEYTKSRCHGKEIRLLIDGKDHYNRLLGHVFVKEGDGFLCINEGLVHEGFATAYTPKKTQKTFNWDKLLKLQKDARKSNRGLWQSFQDVAVFKTPNGSAYHKKSCEHLSRSNNLQKLKISEALDQGLHPCRTCMG